jgi:cytochrome b pre-mRNA-processing protein 3
MTALALVRLERDGDEGNRASVSLTERFVEVMESEHRELGLGDPTLGRVVRKLVGMLARRTELWRTAISGEADWKRGARESLYKGEVPEEALEHNAAAIRALWERLDRASLDRVGQGKFG